MLLQQSRTLHRSGFENGNNVEATGNKESCQLLRQFCFDIVAGVDRALTSILNWLLCPTPTAIAGGGKVFSAVCLCVCFSSRYLNNDAAGVTKRHIEMFHDESWKSTYFGGQSVKDEGHEYENLTGTGLCTLVSAGRFWFICHTRV